MNYVRPATIALATMSYFAAIHFDTHPATPLCGLPTFLFPDCSVCSKTYARGLDFICQRCSDGKKNIAITITVVIMVLIIAFGLAIFSYLVSAEVGGAGRGIVDRVTRWVPMQSIKIIVVAWQILTQVRGDNSIRRPCSSK